MQVGSLFSGIGGFDLGLERAGMSIGWQVENNEYCNRVLEKHWPHVTRYGDIKAIKWEEVETVDLVCGGFPCQPFSCAGKRRGQDDDRYLWPEVVRCLDALRPAWFLGENVPGIINLALDQVCADLESLDYTVWPVCVPACAVDAPHQRQRVWIMAYSRGTEHGRLPGDERQEVSALRGDGEDVADTFSQPAKRWRDRVEWRERSTGQTARDGWAGRGLENERWPAESDVGGMVDGLSEGLDEGGLNDEAMRALQAGNDSTSMGQRQSRLDVQASEILQQSVLRGLENIARQGESSECAEGRTAPGSSDGLPTMSEQEAITAASQGPKHKKQRSSKHRSALPDMPQGRAHERWDVGDRWPLEPNTPRVATGVKNRVHRLRGLGNAIVPQIAEALGRMILVTDFHDHIGAL